MSENGHLKLDDSGVLLRFLEKFQIGHTRSFRILTQKDCSFSLQGRNEAVEKIALRSTSREADSTTDARTRS